MGVLFEFVVADFNFVDFSPSIRNISNHEGNKKRHVTHGSQCIMARRSIAYSQRRIKVVSRGVKKGYVNIFS
jgi:hypothetical protein